jgi:hypothetical protein
MTPFGSYGEYINTILPQWPEFRWLSLFLNAQPVHPECTVDVVHADDTRLQVQTFGSASQDFQAAITDSSADVKTRLIILSYKDIETVDRNVLDVLGLEYDIDPIFYWHHFQGDNPTTDLLPSGRQHLHIGCRPTRRASICIHPAQPGESHVNTRQFCIYVILRMAIVF